MIISEIPILSQIVNYWNTFRVELVEKISYKASISSIWLCFLELQEKNLVAIDIWQKMPKDWEDQEEILYY